MKKLIINQDHLTKEEINKIVRKVRAIIFNEDGKIIISKYAGIYMLPGGKVDLNELEAESLVREIREETGIDINPSEVEPLVKIKTYARNYPERNGNITNRLMETTYYVINTPKNIKEENTNLTDSERNNNFRLLFWDINDIDILLNEYSDNVRKQYFNNELRMVLENFFKRHDARRNKVLQKKR